MKQVTKGARGTRGAEIQVCLAPKLMHVPSCITVCHFFSALLCKGCTCGEHDLEGGNLAVELAPCSDQLIFPLLGSHSLM